MITRGYEKQYERAIVQQIKKFLVYCFRNIEHHLIPLDPKGHVRYFHYFSPSCVSF